MEQYTEENNTADTNPPREGSTFEPQDFFREHLVKTESGKLEITGENLSPVELALLDTEVRRRGSQSASSREKARADKVELELSKVKENVRGIDPKSTEIDDSLKYTDPDEYIRLKLEGTSDPYQDVFDTSRTQAANEFRQLTVDELITAHNTDNPTKQITPNMLELDLPPRLMTEFAEGKMSPQEFLGQAADLLYRPTEVANPPIPGMPDLGKVAGQTSPTDDGSNDKLMENYSTAIF